MINPMIVDVMAIDKTAPADASFMNLIFHHTRVIVSKCYQK